MNTQPDRGWRAAFQRACVLMAAALLLSCGGGDKASIDSRLASARLASAPQSRFRPPLAQSPGAPPTKEAAFDWAPTVYPSIFRGPYDAGEVFASGMNFYYRYYAATNTYLGLADGSSIYVLGPWTSYQLAYVGELAALGCAVNPASCGGTAPTTLEQVTTFLHAYDAFHSEMPADGAAAASFVDGCYLENGESKPWDIAHFDENPPLRKASLRYRVGSQRSNIAILAERESTNGDDSPRHEIDVSYRVTYAEGTVVDGIRETLVTGSTHGACATPESHSALRFLGNQHAVGVSVRARTLRNERYQLATGAPDAVPLTYRREIQFGVYDPRGVATYAIVNGPGPANTIANVAYPFSMKLLSPRIISTAPELLGKLNNYLNYTDTDFFRSCAAVAAGSGVPVAPVANCTGDGMQGFSWGITLFNPAAGIVAPGDNSFASQGWQAGGVYTFAVYADDGWKTVNGQFGKTPIATYTVTLEALPYTFTEMLNGGQDLFPRLLTTSLEPAAIALLIGSGAAATFDASWRLPGPFADGKAFGSLDIYEFFQGPKQGNGQGINFPGYRYSLPQYPVAGATTGTFTITAKPAELARKSYFEYGVEYTDRANRRVNNFVSYF